MGQYLPIVALAVLAVLFGAVSILASRLLNKPRPTPAKTAPYECGIVDQTPPPERAFWTTFLQQDTPVFYGTEKIAAKLGYPIIYVGIERLRRGYYRMLFEELVAEPEFRLHRSHPRRERVRVVQGPEPQAPDGRFDNRRSSSGFR